MSNDLKRLGQVGGAAFIASGLLFLLRAVLDYLAGPPPLSGVELLAWTASNRLTLSLDSEILFFAAVCLVPAVVALYYSLAGVDRLKAVTGCGIMAVTIPVLAAVLVMHGRLMYPVYGIRAATPDLVALVVALFYGGMHAINLLLALATLVLSLAMRRAAFGKGIAYLGFVTVVADVIGSYPDQIGPALTLVTQVFLAAWFVAVGSSLFRTAPFVASAQGQG